MNNISKSSIKIAKILYVSEQLRTADFKDISDLKKYLENKQFDLFDFIYEFKKWEYANHLLQKAKIDQKEYENALEEDDFDKLETMANKITKQMSDKDKREFVDYISYFYPEEAPSWAHMDFTSYVLPSNTWLVHFSDHARSIKENGFQYGMDRMDKLGLTTYFSDAAKSMGGYNFAYIANSRDASFAARKEFFGKNAIMFRSPGIKVIHFGDQQNQIIFYGKDVNPNDMVLIEQEYGNWVVQGGKKGELFVGEDFDDASGWVIKNYRQYQNALRAANKNFIFSSLEETDQEYRGDHSAPTKESGAPIYNVRDVYPDIYERGQEYIYIPTDQDGLNIIMQAQDRPNFKIKIYRAVPKIETPQETIKELEKEYKHIMKHGKPSGNIQLSKKDKEIAEKEIIEKFGSADENSIILQYIENKTNELENTKEEPKKLKIQKEDWITPSKEYAKQHGTNKLKGKYKILQKTVKAKDLYTNGDSLSEWGYDPQ